MSSTVWVVDSGASAHFSVVREDFITLNLVYSGSVAGIYVRVRGHWTCQLTLIYPTGRKCIVTLGKVLFVPDLARISNGNYHRMLSVLVATNRGCRFEFTQSGDKLWTPKGRSFDMIRSNGLVWLPTVEASMEPLHFVLLSKQTDCDTIHKRCAHVSKETIQKLSALGVKGIPKNYSRGMRIFCRSCDVSKSTTVDINRESTRDHDPESCFHTLVVDIYRPVRCPSIGSFSYVLGAVCFKSAFIMAELLKCKSDSVKVFRSFLNKIQLLG
jgi:hypothetical protein